MLLQFRSDNCSDVISLLSFAVAADFREAPRRHKVVASDEVKCLDSGVVVAAIESAFRQVRCVGGGRSLRRRSRASTCCDAASNNARTMKFFCEMLLLLFLLVMAMLLFVES